MEGIKDAELVMVFTAFRHGARAPFSLPSNDPNKDFWPDGLGNLTNEGKRQAYELGESYRQQYDGFLSTDYKSNELYVYSTDTDRTLMTAQCCLAGMYPPRGEQLWNENLAWQPIPVHTNSAENDPHRVDMAALNVKELPSGGTTPRHLEIYDNFNHKYKDEWNRWLSICNPDDPTFHAGIMALDTIFIKKDAGLPYFLPPNVNFPLLVTLLKEGAELFLDVAPDYIKIGKALLDAVLAAIDGHIDGSKKNKMYIYNVHDINIVSAMRQLNICKDDPLSVKFCGYCTFELYKNRASDTYYVKLLFRPTRDSKLVEIPLDENHPYASLDAFQKLVKASQKLVNGP